MTDEERRSFFNLLLLCYRHHVETNDVSEYSVERLQAMKADHEARFREAPYDPMEMVVQALVMEAEKYWAEVRRINAEESVFPDDIRIDIDVDAKVLDIVAKMRELTKWLCVTSNHLAASADALPGEIRKLLEELRYDLTAWDEHPYYLNPTQNRDWECLNIGFPNFVTQVEILIDQLEIRSIENALEASPGSDGLREALHAARRNLLEKAGKVGFVD